MIIGNGQLAKAFLNADSDTSVIFASGVANSNCVDAAVFNRESELLYKTLHENIDNRFIYFSSCALSADDYLLNDYYRHKKKMEEMIQELAGSYAIIRLPQLFGDLKSHSTLINFLYESLMLGREFFVYDGAMRYVIDIDDVKNVVDILRKVDQPNSIIDVANPFRYSVIQLIEILEGLTGKEAKYTLIRKADAYLLDLSEFSRLIYENNIQGSFGVNYFSSKISQRIARLYS